MVNIICLDITIDEKDINIALFSSFQGLKLLAPNEDIIIDCTSTELKNINKLASNIKKSRNKN